MANNLESDKFVFEALVTAPESEKEKIRRFREQYYNFKESWDDYIEKKYGRKISIKL